MDLLNVFLNHQQTDMSQGDNDCRYKPEYIAYTIAVLLRFEIKLINH